MGTFKNSQQFNKMDKLVLVVLLAISSCAFASPTLKEKSAVNVEAMENQTGVSQAGAAADGNAPRCIEDHQRCKFADQTPLRHECCNPKLKCQSTNYPCKDDDKFCQTNEDCCSRYCAFNTLCIGGCETYTCH